MSHKKITNFKDRQVVQEPEKTLLFLQELIANPPRNARKLEHKKNAFAEAQKIPTLKNRDLVVVAQNNKIVLPPELAKLLQKRAVRTISGVSPIGILTKPFECPGKCVYCPTEDRMPKSYMSNQPAAARAVRNNFHPFKQVTNRVAALEDSGHPVSKLEIIVMGGTWSFLPRGYQNWYISEVFRAANSLEKADPNNVLPLFFIDFDGVIADSSEYLFEVMKKAFIEKNIELDNKKFQKIFSTNDFWDFEGSNQIKEKITELELENYTDQVGIFSEIIPVFQTLSQYFDLVIISTNQKPIIENFLNKHNIAPLFKEVVGRETAGNKSEKIKERLEKHNQLAEKTFFLGDSISDIKEGKKAGVQTIGAGWGRIFSGEELAEIHPDIIAEKISDLESIFNMEESHIQAGQQEGEIVEKNFSAKENSAISIGSAKELIDLQVQNETSAKRIIGITLETRPDWINEAELIRMRKYGCTRIEIGVQTLDDEVQKINKRGHFKRHVAKAMKLMKDFGFKVCFHLMPGLPGSNPEKDLIWFREVFENPDMRPDFIKIYPCVVLETAELKTWWDEGKYEPYDDKILIRLLTQFQTLVPEWCRIMRLMRDIPLQNIVDGAKFSNLRQIIESQPEKLKEIVGEEFFNEHELEKIENRKFRDIRAREIGFTNLQNHTEKDFTPILKRRDYTASDGEEVFLSFETQDETNIFALLRLRKPSGTKEFSEFNDVLQNAGLIREVHSYGKEISVGEAEGLGQHRGLGRKLIEEAEKIVKEEWNLKQMTIIAGVGTREYYRKFGYEEKDTYMVKVL